MFFPWQRKIIFRKFHSHINFTKVAEKNPEKSCIKQIVRAHLYTQMRTIDSNLRWQKIVLWNDFGWFHHSKIGSTTKARFWLISRSLQKNTSSPHKKLDSTAVVPLLAAAWHLPDLAELDQVQLHQEHQCVSAQRVTKASLIQRCSVRRGHPRRPPRCRPSLIPPNPERIQLFFLWCF